MPNKTLRKPNLHKVLVVVGGPTAVGKTAMAIALARHFGTEIISADSRQFYRELEIGTAKPTALELRQVPHHFINNLSIRDDYDVGQYEKQALSLLDDLFGDREVVVMVGGSGLFIKAVCEGLDEMPEVDPEIRTTFNTLFQDEGITPLQSMLKKKDPVYYDQVDLNNPARLIRALEVIEASGKPYSGFRLQETAKRAFDVIKIGLEADRELLYQRIDLRMDEMIQAGLFEEAAALRPYAHLNALQTVGYREIFDFLDGAYDKAEAVRLLKRNTRRYAKRQMTWFKKDKAFMWFSGDETDRIIAYIEQSLAHTKGSKSGPA